MGAAVRNFNDSWLAREHQHHPTNLNHRRARSPAADCSAIRAGTVAEVPYTADYYFWK